MKARSRLLWLFAAVSATVAVVFFAGHGDAKPRTPAGPYSLAGKAGIADDDHKFRITSSTFSNIETIPPSMVFSGTLGSACTGGNNSPELSWTRGEGRTRSYVVTVFDVTANFAHWGVYNIPADTTELAFGAGAPSSTSLSQVFNDAGIQGYSGPCPPPDLVPNGIHQYVFTVYAVDTQLNLTQSPDFPPGADALYRAMIGHVIEQASITGLFSCGNASSCQ